MSNIYVQEPSTSGKVLIVTTSGDIDIELWPKETPKACRNFIQLCLDGYYDGTIIHRIIKGFIAQGGDPTGTGEGGESIYGAPFKDEFHQRIRFNRRGLVAMANAGPNDNGSQFFFTLDRCDHLNGKHTIFGKVTGPTLYNMLQLADRDIGPSDRPFNPPTIKRTEVLANPFPDVERRAPQQSDIKFSAEPAIKSKSRATKNFSLLSFGEEAEEDEEEVVSASKTKKIVSSHDVLDDPKLSSRTLTEENRDESTNVAAPAAAAHVKRKRHNSSDRSGGSGSDGSDDDRYNRDMKQRVADKLQRKKKAKDALTVEKVDEGDFISPRQRELDRKKAELRREALLLKKSMQKKADSDVESGDDRQAAPVSAAVEDYRNQLQQYGERKKSQIKKGSSRENQAMALLEKFSSRLQSAGSGQADDSSLSRVGQYPDDDGDGAAEASGKGNSDNDDDTGWLGHSLVCDDTGPRVAKDASTVTEDTYNISDPRHPINKRRRKAQKHRERSKGFHGQGI